MADFPRCRDTEAESSVIHFCPLLITLVATARCSRVLDVRAIHMEIVHSFDILSFVDVLQWFISRRSMSVALVQHAHAPCGGDGGDTLTAYVMIYLVGGERALREAIIIIIIVKALHHKTFFKIDRSLVSL